LAKIFVIYQSTLHIISFDIPYPANYGGVIDVFYKIKALHKLGLKVILHSFQYGERSPQKDLEKYTEKTFYYSRNTSPIQQLSMTPYITKSRQHSDLLHNLLQDNHPILAEGLHCAGFFNHPKLKSRLKILRMHNIEWKYYESLAKLSEKIWEKTFFHLESLRLKRFEKSILNHANHILAISETEQTYFKIKHTSVHYIPPFHPNEVVDIDTSGIGEYALFHGKLSVPDNELAALMLINDVFAKVDFPLIIAGKEATKKLYKAAKDYPHITIKTNVPSDEMQQLQRNAQMHVLWTFQAAGMKLKLLETLFTGRHCVVNDLMVEGTGVKDLVHICNDTTELQVKIKSLQNKKFTDTEMQRRYEMLNLQFSNLSYANVILDLLG